MAFNSIPLHKNVKNGPFRDVEKPKGAVMENSVFLGF
jgi:hypothetical protein